MTAPGVTPRLCALCGAPIIGRHGRALVCWECYAAGHTIRRAHVRDYETRAILHKAGFYGCEDCAACKKTACRHNPKNPEKHKISE